MGLFSSKKKTYVSSSVWNMAGDIQDRANYLKSIVVGNILMDSPYSIGETIPNSYLKGPGMGLRRYATWAKGSSNYDDNVGFVGGGLVMGDSLNSNVLEGQIPHGPNEYVVMGQSDIGWADYTWWAEEYMVNNHQDLLFTDWFAEVADGTNEITITFADTTTVSFMPVGYDPSKKYLYALYQTVSGGTNGTITPGPVIIVPDEASFPSTDGYRLFSTIVTSTPDVLETLTVVDITYSDATPPEHTEDTTTEPVDLDLNERTYDKYTLIDTTNSSRELYIQTRKDVIVSGTPEVTVVTEDIGGGVIKTTTTTVTAEEVELELSYHIDTQTVVNDSVSEYKYFRYQEDTGNAVLDPMFDPPVDSGAFLPYIPIRINNEFIKDTNPDLYDQTKRAYKKAMAGGSMDTLVEKISDNEQLGDLDFVYAVYGTSLNSPENTARIYMFNFFDKMLSTNPDSFTKFSAWQARWALAEASMIAYKDWADSRTSTSTTPPPPIIPYPSLPVLQIDTRSTTDWMNFHMNIAFNGASKSSGTGSLGGHKKGDYWIEMKPATSYTKQYTVSKSDGTSETYYEVFEIEQLAIYHQDLDNHWVSLDIYGLVHTNYVYDNKTVVIKCSEAMSDPEESGFIIPLHEETFREMRLIDATQLATACCYLVFNCYVVKKTKWYQSGWFKILLIVVIVAVSIIFPPAAGAGGVLGSSIGVGTALGFTGTAALVAGTVANALAAIIIMKALTTAFGDKWGPLLGTLVTAMLTAYGGIGGGGSFDAGSFATELSKADNLIAITDGLVKGVSAYMQEKAQEIYAETQAMMERHKTDMLQIQKQYEEMFGTGTGGVIDPLMFTSAAKTGVGEPRGAFLERTLMCGSDIAKMSQDLVRNFSAITLSLDLPS